MIAEQLRCLRQHDLCGQGENEPFPWSWPSEEIIFGSFFSARVRAFDVRDPFHPKEIASFIPAITEKTDKRCVKDAGQERCKVAIQTNNVDIDERGYVYIVDRANTGLHILELTGDARKVVGPQ